jgi:hypothetical protein
MIPNYKLLFSQLSKWNPSEEFISFIGSWMMLWATFTYFIWASPIPALNIFMSAVYGLAFCSVMVLGMVLICAAAGCIWYLFMIPLRDWFGRIEKSSKDS